MGKVIVIANQKGGVGKTTTCFSLGVGLARAGKKTLLIDADPQGSLTICAGEEEPDALEETLSNIMEKVIEDDEVEDSYGIRSNQEGIDYIASNIELAAMEVSLINVMSRETILKEYIGKIREKYDYILIDCMPSLGLITINAFAAADSVLIPMQSNYLSIKGMQQLIKSISKIKRKINPRLEFEGLLLTMVNIQTRNAREIMEICREVYGNEIKIFQNYIPASVRAAETSCEGISIYKYDEKGTVAKAYAALTGEVLENEKKTN